MPRIGILFLSFACCMAAACQRTPPAGLGANSMRRAPLPLPELPTTAGALALSNLQGQIEGEEHLAIYRPLTVKQRAGIIDLVSMRGQFLGHLADYERAADLAAQLVDDDPMDGAAFVARAKTLATFHEFTAALRDLDHAAELGVAHAAEIRLRAAILQATGRYDDALVVRCREAEARPDITTIGAEASVYAERGDVDEAERLFSEAPRHYRDVSPFPVVWLYFQQGLMWMREGDLARAREFFAAAHERLPDYAAAQGHLAEVEAAIGNRDRAIALLRPLAKTADDPDYAAQLARILLDAGQVAEAGHWRAIAARRYDAVTARHPLAFADHAAEFWLAAGADPEKALVFALRNRDNRPTARAYELVLQAALASGHAALACEAAAHTRTLPHRWPSLQTLTSRASAACGDA